MGVRTPSKLVYFAYGPAAPHPVERRSFYVEGSDRRWQPGGA
jgi:hypothetical protein